MFLIIQYFLPNLCYFGTKINIYKNNYIRKSENNLGINITDANKNKKINNISINTIDKNRI